MNGWYTTVYKALIFAGIMSFIMGFFTESKTSLGAYFAGYSVFVMSIMMILVILFYNILKTNQNAGFSDVLYNVFIVAGPFMLILAIIAYVFYLLVKYKNKIVDGNVSKGYNIFNNVIVMLLLVQFYVIYSSVSSEQFSATGKIPKTMAGLVYLLSVLTGISAIILTTILKYYSTDGFRLLNLNEFIR